jgi:hypothetical protein
MPLGRRSHLPASGDLSPPLAGPLPAGLQNQALLSFMFLKTPDIRFRELAAEAVWAFPAARPGALRRVSETGQTGAGIDRAVAPGRLSGLDFADED